MSPGCSAWRDLVVARCLRVHFNRGRVGAWDRRQRGDFHFSESRVSRPAAVSRRRPAGDDHGEHGLDSDRF